MLINNLKAIMRPLLILRERFIHSSRERRGRKDSEALAKFLFKKILGYDLNLTNPITLNEKVNYLKFRTDTKLWTELSDKYRIRHFIENKNLSNILVKIYGKWTNPDLIDFAALPNSFVLKANNGSGTVLIVKDKNLLDTKKVKKLLNKWLKIKYGYSTAEPHYIDIEPCIIAEELLENDSSEISSSLIDYKWYCFNGEPKFVRVATNRECSSHSYGFAFYDTNWKRYKNYEVDISKYYSLREDIPCPKNLKDMLSICSELSKNFPQVRVDLYEVNSKVYFGELTFTSAAGYDTVLTSEFDKLLGSYTII